VLDDIVIDGESLTWVADACPEILGLVRGRLSNADRVVIHRPVNRYLAGRAVLAIHRRRADR
jgi:hypothetical protein